MTDKTKWNLISAGLGIVLGLAVAIPQYIHWQNTKPELIVVYHPEWYSFEVEEEEEDQVEYTLDYGYIEIDNSRNTWEHISMSDEEYELMSRVIEAEAGNQSLYGKQLVADVIFNRVTSEDFPNTIYGVITQDGQFSAYLNGSYKSVTPSDETYEAIALEYEYLANAEVLFFKTGGYHIYGDPLFKEGDHYFNGM